MYIECFYYSSAGRCQCKNNKKPKISNMLEKRGRSHNFLMVSERTCVSEPTSLCLTLSLFCSLNLGLKFYNIKPRVTFPVFRSRSTSTHARAHRRHTRKQQNERLEQVVWYMNFWFLHMSVVGFGRVGDWMKKRFDWYNVNYVKGCSEMCRKDALDMGSDYYCTQANATLVRPDPTAPVCRPTHLVRSGFFR